MFKYSIVAILLIQSLWMGLFGESIQTNYAEHLLYFQRATSLGNEALTLEIQLKDGWYTYGEDPGDLGVPLSVDWTLPPGVKVGGMEWPDYESVVSEGKTSNRITGTAQWRIPVELNGIDADAVWVKARVRYLACSDTVCIPQTVDLRYQEGRALDGERGRVFFSSSFWIALCFACLGGVILNGMPCVFPVISLKLLALAKKSQKSKREIWLQGIGYALGVIITFIVLGAMVSILQKAGHIVGWGFQLQSPIFIVILIFLLWVIGLNLSGLVEWPRFLLSIPGKVAGLLTGHHQNDDFVASIFTGVLASILATPCTAPLMAPAIAYGLTQPPIVTVSIFFMLGLGMALPFLVVCGVPGLIAFLPSSGFWMTRFKEFLALPMYGAVLWLFWVLSKQVSPMLYNITLIGVSMFALFILIVKKYSISKRITVIIMILLFSVLLLLIPKNGRSSNTELAVYDALAQLERLRNEEKEVFVDVTAAWCLSCKVNEALVLRDREVQALFQENEITLITLDWTNQSDAITRYLLQFNRNGVPLYVFYPKEGGAVILPQVLSKSIVMKTIRGE